MSMIISVHARQILDSRGNPTVEVDVETENGVVGRAAVPSGASTGEHEAVELRDGGSAYMGKGVLKAVENVNTHLSDALLGVSVFEQNLIDQIMIDLDAPIAFQEFMVMPVKAESFSHAMQMGTEIFHHLKKVLHDRGLSTAVGDEGGFAPTLDGTEDALDTIAKAVSNAGYTLGDNVMIALDCAAAEVYVDGKYDYSKFEGPNGAVRSSEEQAQYLADLAAKYPIISIEDGMDENDWAGWKSLTEKVGDSVQLVGDDLFVTNVERLSRGISEGIANSILIKVNQIGTLTETIAAVNMAKNAGYTSVMSHRSGETEDNTIADLAVALNTGQIKTGSASRSDRMAKYNQLLRIEEMLGETAYFPKLNAFKIKK